MTIEAALEANTKALVALTAAVDAQNKRLDNIAPAKTSATTDTKPSTETKAAAKKTTTAKTTKKTTTAKKDDGFTAEALLNVVRDFMGMDDDAEARQARRDFVTAILSELGIKQVFDAAEEDRPRIVSWIKKFMETGGPVDFDSDSDETGGDDAGEDDLLGG